MTRGSLCNPSLCAFDNHNDPCYRRTHGMVMYTLQETRDSVYPPLRIVPHFEDEYRKSEEDLLPPYACFGPMGTS